MLWIGRALAGRGFGSGPSLIGVRGWACGWCCGAGEPGQRLHVGHGLVLHVLLRPSKTCPPAPAADPPTSTRGPCQRCAPAGPHPPFGFLPRTPPPPHCVCGVGLCGLRLAKPPDPNPNPNPRCTSSTRWTRSRWTATGAASSTATSSPPSLSSQGHTGCVGVGVRDKSIPGCVASSASACQRCPRVAAYPHTTSPPPLPGVRGGHARVDGGVGGRPRRELPPRLRHLLLRLPLPPEPQRHRLHRRG